MVVEQIIVGSRIDSFGWRGTVRYVGEVAGTDGIWLGIDWDEPERGKHNGTYNGSQYFQASYPTSGSFVRPSKVKIGKSVIEAIEERYGVMTDPNIGLDQETILQLQRNIKATFFEVVGVSKLNQIQSDFKNLRVVLLRDFLVNGAGPPLGLLRLCPSIQELDLSKTLLDSWGTVAQITNQLKNLTILNLSENRLKLTEDIDSEAFKTIEHIILGKLMYSWSEILKCSELFLNIKALQVQYNKIDIIEAPSEKLFRNLLMLDLEGNPVTSWEEINNLGGLHTLETLNVSCCGLKGVLFPNSTSPLNLFKNLKNLMLTGNEIDNWSSISELDKLQSLYDLRFKDNPILVKENVETNHQLITAKIGKLQVLNGQQVLRDERKGAEIDYLKRFGTTWLALKTEDERKKFNAIHPRYMQLVAKYGPPEENEVKEMPTSLKSQLIQIEISSSEKTFSKKVPYNMSVQKLSGLIQRLFNTGSTIPHLSCIHAERTDGLAVPLEDYLKDLNFYSIENGDKISVNW